MSENNPYCKIYLASSAAMGALLSALAGIISGTVDGRTVIGHALEIDLRENEDRQEYYPRSQPDYFIRYPYYLDVTPAKHTSEAQYRKSLSTLLFGLWDAGMDAVAACDFEESLPRKGGYSPH